MAWLAVLHADHVLCNFQNTQLGLLPSVFWFNSSKLATKAHRVVSAGHSTMATPCLSEFTLILHLHRCSI
jgi:hypothetical protein